jgi:hypothetical protein
VFVEFVLAKRFQDREILLLTSKRCFQAIAENYNYTDPFDDFLILSKDGGTHGGDVILSFQCRSCVLADRLLHITASYMALLAHHEQLH